MAVLDQRKRSTGVGIPYVAVSGLRRTWEAFEDRLKPDTVLRRGGSSIALACLLVAITAAVASCARTPPLAASHDDADALARAVLDAVAAGDRARLEALALDEAEFRAHVWPWLPAAREERNLPFSYVWGDLRQKSGQSLSTTLAGHGRRRYELVKVEFEGTTDYGPYRVHRQATFVVRSGGDARAVRLCGSMLEKDGRWKIFSYVVDD